MRFPLRRILLVILGSWQGRARQFIVSISHYSLLRPHYLPLVSLRLRILRTPVLIDAKAKFAGTIATDGNYKCQLMFSDAIVLEKSNEILLKQASAETNCNTVFLFE